jgi:CheY-like chemotaxis protein
MALNDPATTPLRVLVVEDSPWDQELLLRQLRMAQMADHVVFVPDAFRALELLYADAWAQSEFIAIFLDIGLPGMSGVELLQRIRARPKMEDFPVIVMTSSNDSRHIEECRKLKVLTYVDKPITFSSFSKAVANLFHRVRETSAG